jgi:hypothetical protein
MQPFQFFQAFQIFQLGISCDPLVSDDVKKSCVIHGAIASLGGYAVTALLAGKALWPLGVLIPAGTSVFAGVGAALLATVVFIAFKAVVAERSKNSYINLILSGAVALIASEAVFSGPLSGVLLINLVALIFNAIFLKIAS